MRRWPWLVAWALLLGIVAFCVRTGEMSVVTVGVGDYSAALAATGSPAGGNMSIGVEDFATDAAPHGIDAHVSTPVSTPVLAVETPAPAPSFGGASSAPAATMIPTAEPTPMPPAFSIAVESVQEEGLTYHVAHVTLTDASQLRTALAGGTYSPNARQYTSHIAEANGAVFAVNGDYFAFRDNGVVVREGALLRDKPSGKEALIIDSAGDLSIAKERELDTDAFPASGVRQVFSFGPALMEDGAVLDMPEKYFISLRNREPRTGIGQVGPLQYVFICVDGRVSGSDGIALDDFARLFERYGCTIAYNLDGGGSSTMYYDGEIVNRIQGGGQRSVSDIIYIAVPHS